MFRSPPKLRPRGKPSDKTRKVERSLSVDCDPVSLTVMGPKPDISSIDEAIRKHLADPTVIEAIVNSITDRLKVAIGEAVAAAFGAAQAEINRLTNEVSSLRQILDRRTDDLEQYQRRANLRVFGIPERAGENTDELVINVCRDKLGVELPVSSIDRSHRVGRRRDPGPDGKVIHRPIIVRFISYRDRRRIFEAKKKLKGTGITIREDLTAMRLRVFKAAEAKFGLRNAWTVDGTTKWVTGEGTGRTFHSATTLAELTNS